VPTFSHFLPADLQTSRFAPAGQLEICSIGMREIRFPLPQKMPISTLLTVCKDIRNKDIKLALQYAIAF
jgi:hypothetical protein